MKPFYNDLDPKAVTNDELFGVINPATREWKDGLFSTIMRDMANMPGDGPKWIVLDGDIDPMWIESLNTLMDDNKVNIEYLFNSLLRSDSIVSMKYSNIFSIIVGINVSK